LKAHSEKEIRRSAFVSLPDLKLAIDGCMRAWHENPKPIPWTASVGRIIEKMNRARIKMEQIEPGFTLARAIL
jgi:hypothetical protein